MTPARSPTDMDRNVAFYPWFKFLQGMLFWQAVWFLYFQSELSAAEAVLLYAIYDVATTAMEVPSGYMSDRLGRRVTLVASAVAGLAGAALLGLGTGFAVFAAAQILLGAGSAFASGTDSALLYESLAARGRVDEIERQELRAWRFSFVALALSAFLGGLMTIWNASLPFLASAAAFLGVLLITIRFSEPVRTDTELPQGAELIRLGSLRTALTEPVLVWFFALAVLMYVFSHILFVFGQPFILQALQARGLEQDAPAISGIVSALMMLISVLASMFAPVLRRRLGLPMILLLAFGLQIALSGTLAATDAAPAIAVLFLRMVPNSLARPFILARVQPMLQNDSRATYLSLQSLAGRLILAASLYLASFAMGDQARMDHADIRLILGWYAGTGIVCLCLLAVLAGRLPIDGKRR
ncbi:MFS transporter [Sedimentitalea sp. JM2-8]|uniref:MFS transporter n=1 Tax=Sedimentitalea xiamensis TaxID=3050037 RepID=A0ABT7F906_9RHOB|nr:MFS transporter [Sedimentitalea xiamensis]MDK3071597.1 MFS transporter [Sedimentitalea xiamensis]